MVVQGKHVGLFFVVILLCFIAGVVLFPPGSTSALLTVAAVTLLTCITSFIFGILTGDYSWTDRLWSTSPVGYAWIYAAAASWSSASVLAALLVTLWGARLTFNFARRGGYTGGEDYRWPILRKRIHNPMTWQLFHALFIALYQQALFIGFTLPLFVISSQDGGITFMMIIFALVMIAFLILETKADQQQYIFQQSKYGHRLRVKAYEEDYKRGFLTHGLFEKSRHPNYLGELGVWWSIYAIGALSAGSILHWSIIGPVLLTGLFIGSTWFTESITVSKYQSYRHYQRRTWPIVPKFRR